MLKQKIKCYEQQYTLNIYETQNLLLKNKAFHNHKFIGKVSIL